MGLSNVKPSVEAKKSNNLFIFYNSINFFAATVTVLTDG